MVANVCTWTSIYAPKNFNFLRTFFAARWRYWCTGLKQLISIHTGCGATWTVAMSPPW